MCGEDLYLLHSGAEEGLGGGRGGAGAKFGKVAAALVNLGDVDLGWTSSTDRDKAFVLSFSEDEEESGAFANEEVAIQEARWLISKGKARLQGVLSDGSADITVSGMERAREVLREIDDKVTAIKIIQSEPLRLRAAQEMCENYAYSLAITEEIGTGVGGAMLETKLERIVAVERQIGRGQEFKGDKEGDGKERNDDDTKTFKQGESLVPSSPLATLLSTVFSPLNLSQ